MIDQQKRQMLGVNKQTKQAIKMRESMCKKRKEEEQKTIERKQAEDFIQKLMLEEQLTQVND